MSESIGNKAQLDVKRERAVVGKEKKREVTCHSESTLLNLQEITGGRVGSGALTIMSCIHKHTSFSL